PGEYDYRYRYESYTEGEETGRRLWLVGYVGDGETANIPGGIYGIKRFSSNTESNYWRTFYADAFYGRESLKKVVIPEGTVRIHDGSFINCYNLTDITFPSTLKVLEQNTFRWCGRDAAEPFYFVLPDNMEDMTGRGGGAQTFSDCDAILQTGKFSKTAELLSDRNFCYTTAEERDFRFRYETYPRGDESGRRLWVVGYAGAGGDVTIPDGVYGIRRYQWDPPYGTYEPSFYGDKAIRKVVIPEGVEVIEDSAFSGCTLLADISLPDTLRVLKNHAFEFTGTDADRRFIVVLPAGLEEMTTGNGAGWASFNGSAATLVVQNAVIANYMYEDWWQYYGNVADAEARINLIRKPNDQEGFKWNGCP
ncbi:MAG: leucine-rich repeat domain-containing protein, partial [Oscillibacter sp.]|nr:leucine-rich repeat domain-containing protein [Oscillibacter sp.]